VQEVQEVVDRLGGQARVALGAQERLDGRRVDLVQRAVGEERREVQAQVAAVVADRRRLALHDELQVLDVGLAGLGHGAPLVARQDGVGLDALAQLALGLGAGQPVAGGWAALGAEAALDAHAAGPPRAVPALAPGLVRGHEEPSASVRTPVHAAIMTRV
jgi:hypothetical protein